MFAILIEAEFRSLAVAACVWLILVVLRIRNPSVQRTSWLVATVASLSMPLLMQVGTINIPPNSIPVVLDAPQLAAVTAVSSDWQSVIAAIYLAASGVLLARLAFGITHTWRLTRRAKRVTELSAKHIDIRTTPAVRAPVTFAVTILLPVDWHGWNKTKLQAVLAHESTHVRNRDFFWQMLAQAHRAIFWFSPLAWWLPKTIGQLSEIISDDAAIDRISDRPTYANILFEVARDAHRIPTALSMARPATVKARIERALSATQKFSELRRGAQLSIAISLMPLVALAASGSTTEGQRKPTDSGAVTTPQKIERPSGKNKVVSVAPTFDRENPLSKPPYPKQSKLNRETGVTYLHLLVGASGTVLDGTVQKSSGYPALDASALEAAKASWQFKAGTVNNVPTPAWVTVPIVFKLDDDKPKDDGSENHSSQSGAAS